MQGTHRHSFWNEAYETALAWYIMWPVLFALVSPSKGKFNVTSKGGSIHEGFFDWKIGTPYIVMFILNFAGLILGLFRMFWFNTFEWDTALINMLWTIYNLIMLSATIAVVLESRQIRKSWRIEREIPAIVGLPTGEMFNCTTTDYSEGGVSLNAPKIALLKPEEPVDLYLLRGEIRYKLPAIVVSQNQNAKRLRVRFENLTIEQERNLIAATLSRGDAWLNWLKDRNEVDHPLRGLFELLSFSLLGVKRLIGAARSGA
jgi:cellulose synthase (UDP-forming)